MGDFRITIDAVGGHGCARNIAEPASSVEESRDPNRPRPPLVIKFARCMRMTCPDCLAIEFAEEFARKFSYGVTAKLEHWPKRMLQQDGSYVERPDAEVGPIDDLLKGTRDRQFKG